MVQKLIIIIIVLTSINVSAQTKHPLKYKFTYLLTYQADSTDTYSKKSEEMLLLTNKNISIFQSKNSYIRDSLLFAMKNQPAQDINMLDISKFPKTKFHYKILKESSKDSMIVYDKIYTDNFRYNESKENINWIIGSDTLTVNGFKCQKAITTYSGRDYEAWFSVEIPISDGPYKFSGLPGLIIQISDLKRHYVFELISKSEFNQQYSNLQPQNNLFITTKPVFFEKLKDFKRNVIERLAQSGFTIDDEYKQQVKQTIRKRNNPLELKGINE